jgi:hypothetical protein
MMRIVIVSACSAAALAVGGCGGGEEKTITVPPSAYSKKQLPKVEPVHGNDYETQALEGSIARAVQWGNIYYGKTVLDTTADNTCQETFEDIWKCFVTVIVTKPFKGTLAGRRPGGYTVSRDSKTNRLVFIPGVE